MEVNTIDCIYFVIQKAISKQMINLNAKKIVFAIKIINLDAEMFIEKVIVAFVFKINGGSIYMVMILINQDIMMLCQIIVLVSEIRYLRTIVFLLVFCFINVIIKEQYF